MIWDLECQSLDNSSGLVKVASYNIFVKLYVTIKPIKPCESDFTEHRKFKYKHEVKGPNDEVGCLVMPP